MAKGPHTISYESGSFCPESCSPSFINSALKNTIANIRILDVVRLVHGYFILIN